MSFATLRELLTHFATTQRYFLLPLVLILGLAGIVLLMTSGVALVAPLVYTLF